MEIQANLFASQLLLPPQHFEIVYKALFHLEGIRNYPNLTVDNQRCNIELSNWVFKQLSAYFNVSITAIKKRLIELDYLHEIYPNHDNY